MVLKLKNTHIHDGEDYHHFQPHILFRRLKTSYRLRLFPIQQSKDGAVGEKSEDEMLYLCDDDECE
jgi:hypothetical protein